jgi:hypothetical protein
MTAVRRVLEDHGAIPKRLHRHLAHDFDWPGAALIVLPYAGVLIAAAIVVAIVWESA